MTIEQIQNLLAFLGYYRIPVDGIDGPGTHQAIIDFQRDNGVLDVDGIAGEKTQMALRHAVCYGMPDYEPDSWDDITYFVREEFRCQCGGEYCNGFPAEPSIKLAGILDQIREHFEEPVIVTSGVRCEQHNAEVGGVSNSQHLYGTAADIVVMNVDPSEVADYAETLLPDSGGIGRYDDFTHIDVRPDRARW